ncbi:MAG: U32 family peptidase [Nitrospirae bacterium]|nr:U32 family peptidase [Nitrospirota bacterium]
MNITTKKPELLAPAGNFEKLKTAVHYGADAVYLGDGRFSLRAMTGNFDAAGIQDAVAYCRERGVKVYVTANIFPHNNDIQALRGHIGLLGEIKPDAVVVSDHGLVSIIKENAPGIPFHISTQANITNYMSARFWQDLGASGIVLARELSLKEVREIREKVSLELEAFVHGSLCISYSGRCYLSSFMADRSANSGECTNSCRWNYYLVEEKRPGEYFPIMEDDRGTYVMSSRDLCTIDHVPELVEAGIDSFKIEGRMKGINYVGGVVKAYREAIDDCFSNRVGFELHRARWARELAMVSSRGYTNGMYFSEPDAADYNIDKSSYRMSHDIVGIVKEIHNGYATILLKSKVSVGDSIEFLSRGIDDGRAMVSEMLDENGVPKLIGKNTEIIRMSVPSYVSPNDIIRREKGRSTE